MFQKERKERSGSKTNFGRYEQDCKMNDYAQL